MWGILVLAILSASPGSIPSHYDPWEEPRTHGLLQANKEGNSLAGENPVLFWNETALEIIRLERAFPPPASRLLAILHRSIDQGLSLLESEDPAIVSLVIAGAAHEVLSTLHPQQRPGLDERLANWVGGDACGSVGSSLDMGRVAARELLALRAHDGATSETIHVHSMEIGSWRPTRPNFRPALLPHWGNVTPFALESTRDFWPPPPPDLVSEKYAVDLLEVVAVGEYFSNSRTEEESEIALFWAEQSGSATPPGAWNRIATVVSRQAGLGARETSHLFMILNVAIADATIACWEAKYSYDYWRPITAVALASADGNSLTSPVPGWTPLIVTPPFPDYPSGHSMISGAAAEILFRRFGREMEFELPSDNLPLQFGIPDTIRRFGGFRSAADEASKSRIYGGIHYRFACEEGLKAGARIGEVVWNSLGSESHRINAFLLY